MTDVYKPVNPKAVEPQDEFIVCKREHAGSVAWGAVEGHASMEAASKAMATLAKHDLRVGAISELDDYTVIRIGSINWIAL